MFGTAGQQNDPVLSTSPNWCGPYQVYAGLQASKMSCSCRHQPHTHVPLFHWQHTRSLFECSSLQILGQASTELGRHLLVPCSVLLSTGCQPTLRKWFNILRNAGGILTKMWQGLWESMTAPGQRPLPPNLMTDGLGDWYALGCSLVLIARLVRKVFASSVTLSSTPGSGCRRPASVSICGWSDICQPSCWEAIKLAWNTGACWSARGWSRRPMDASRRPGRHQI